MKEQKLVYAEKSAKPSILKILFCLFVGDFIACILYGIAMGAGGSIDAQMDGAPAFLAELAVITALLAILFYRLAGRRVTTVAIYERTVVFSAPKVPMKDEDSPSSAEPVHEEAPEPAKADIPAAEPEPAGEIADFGGEEAPVRRENPYLRKNRQKKEAEKEKKPDSPNLSNITWDVEDRAVSPEKRIGKVTPDIPNSEVECPIEQLRSASRKGKSVVLIMENGDRYLFVRMAGAEQLVKVIEDKVAAVVK